MGRREREGRRENIRMRIKGEAQGNPTLEEVCAATWKESLPQFFLPQKNVFSQKTRTLKTEE